MILSIHHDLVSRLSRPGLAAGWWARRRGDQAVCFPRVSPAPSRPYIAGVVGARQAGHDLCQSPRSILPPASPWFGITPGGGRDGAEARPFVFLTYCPRRRARTSRGWLGRDRRGMICANHHDLVSRLYRPGLPLRQVFCDTAVFWGDTARRRGHLFSPRIARAVSPVPCGVGIVRRFGRSLSGRTVMTDENGRFQFINIAPGSYGLTAVTPHHPALPSSKSVPGPPQICSAMLPLFPKPWIMACERRNCLCGKRYTI